MTPVHFSTLKAIHQSPAHYLAATKAPREQTRAMLIGSAVHQLVLGPGAHPVLFCGLKDRRAKEWKDREAAAPSGASILTVPEETEARAIAHAVLNDPIATEYLTLCQREVALRWEYNGVPRETHGVDFVCGGHFGDLKTTRCAEPTKFSREAVNLLYHVQLADYQEALRQNGRDVLPAVLIAVENQEPYCVVVLKMPEEILALGRALLTKWHERLRACMLANEWPGYVQSAIEFETPDWVGDLEGLEE